MVCIYIIPSLYEIHDIQIVNTTQTLPLQKKFSSTNPTKFWLLRIGHNLDKFNRFVRGYLVILVVEPIPICESSLEGKMTKPYFP